MASSMASIPTGRMISGAAIWFPATDPGTAAAAPPEPPAAARRFLWAAYSPAAWGRLEALCRGGGSCGVGVMRIEPMPRNEWYLLLGFWIAVTLVTGARLLFGA